MNMVRIRQIMEVRKALKAPPLLPPKVRGKHKSSEADKKNSIKEIIHLDLRAHLLNNPTTSAEKLIEASISDNDYDGPWKTVSTPRLRVLDDLLEVYDLCSIDYTFQKRQCIKFELYNLVKPNNILLGYTIFPISEIICENGFLSKDIISEDNEEPLLRISISYWLETSEPPVLLQFVGRNLSKKAISDNLRFQFKIYRIEINDERYLIYQSEFLPFISKVIWKQFFLRKSLLADEINRKLEVVCYQRDNAGKDEIVGRFQTSFSEMQRYLETQDVYFLNKSLKAIKKEKATATFDIIKCSETIMCSFLDYISAGSRIQTAIAIDFSTSASPTGNEIPAAILVDDIELVLFTLLETLKDYNFSKNCAAFGFGAKIPPLYRDSQQFCLNFDTDPHCTGTNGVIEAFRQAYITVQPVPNAHFSHIIYHVSKLAENTRKRNQASLPQYFVLIIITPGSVDDLRETIQAIIFASKAPLSIVFVGIGNNDFSEIEKLGFSGSRLAYQGRKVERDMLQFISLAEIYNDQEEEDIRELIAEKALSQIPRQMSTWMMKNGYSAEGKKSSIMSNSNFDPDDIPDFPSTSEPGNRNCYMDSRSIAENSVIPLTAKSLERTRSKKIRFKQFRTMSVGRST